MKQRGVRKNVDEGKTFLALWSQNVTFNIQHSTVKGTDNDRVRHRVIGIDIFIDNYIG
jgi:hypothetical protein